MLQQLNFKLTMFNVFFMFQSLIVVTSSNVYSVKLSICSAYNSCSECEADPYCDWTRMVDSLLCIETNAGNFEVA